MTKLMIVQCGGQKIWKKNASLGPVAAGDAYTSGYFGKNKAYAKAFGDRWMILSAKYGFIDPDEKIEDYNVTFKTKKGGHISISSLQEQVKNKKLSKFDEIVVLGGKEYLIAVEGAFDGTSSKIISPFKGMKIGPRMSAVDKALGEGKDVDAQPITRKPKEPRPPTPRAAGTSTDDIRRYVYDELISPPIEERGQSEITIRAGDVHKLMGLKSRMPMVCSALKGLDKYYPVELISIQAPPSGKGSNFYVTYKI